MILSTIDFPVSCKFYILIPLIKTPSLYPEVSKDRRGGASMQAGGSNDGSLITGGVVDHCMYEVEVVFTKCSKIIF